MVRWLLTIVFIFAGFASAQQQGVYIEADDEGVFNYSDDFSTAKFLQDAFLSNLDLSCWSPGSIANTGPNRNRMLTYRFYGDMPIEGIDITLNQRANSRSLGGNNYLYISPNGLDWTLAAKATDYDADGSGWYTTDLTADSAQAAMCIGAAECYIRIVLDNTSGLRTGVSSVISNLDVQITVDQSQPSMAGTDDPSRQAFSRSLAEANDQAVIFDSALPAEDAPACYFEDFDGFLLNAQDADFPNARQNGMLLIHRAYAPGRRQPLALAFFAAVENNDQPAALAICIASDSASCRRLDVVWDGQVLATFDAASFLPKEKRFYVQLPADGHNRLHSLRLVPQDSGAVHLKNIILTGPANPSFAQKPAMASVPTPRVLAAGYMPDPLPPADSQTVEGRDANWRGVNMPHMQQLYQRYQDFGALRVCFYNNADQQLRVRRVLLNGTPVEDHYVDFTSSAWDARGVVWYRVQPMTIAPQGCAEAYVRFRQRPAGDQAELTIEFENAEPLHLNIAYTNPATTIDYVTTDASAERLYVYVRQLQDGAAAPRSLLFDGVELENAALFGPDYPGNVALFTADLPEPLTHNSYHVVSIEHEDGTTAAAQFRQVAFFFPRSSIHTPASICQDMAMNLALWSPRPLEICQRYDIYTTVGSNSIFDLHERVAYAFGPDEPDAHDNRGGGYDVGLGANARALAQGGWQQLITRYAPHVSTWLIMNGTTRPLNWFVYGQFADISCFDPYPVTFYGADHNYVGESLALARYTGMPRRMFACLEAYGWSSGQGVPGDARGPVRQEYRQNIVQAIGAGMKGLTSWVYSSNAGGWQGHDDFAAEVAAMNRLLESIEDKLLIATPADLVSSNTDMVATGRVGAEEFMKPRVATAALLAGPDAIIVTAVNHIPASKPQEPQITPAEGVRIVVQLPDYFSTDLSAREVTPDGFVSYPITVDNNAHTATIQLGRLIDGRVFIIE